MFGVGSGARMEAPPGGITPFSHTRNAKVAVGFAILVPIPAGEEFGNIAPLIPGGRAIDRVEIIAIARFEVAVDGGIGKEIFAEGVVVDVTIVGQGVDFPFPGQGFEDARQHIVDINGGLHLFGHFQDRLGANHVGPGVALELIDISQIGASRDRLHDLVSQFLLPKRTTLKGNALFFQIRLEEILHRRTHAL